MPRRYLRVLVLPIAAVALASCQPGASTRVSATGSARLLLYVHTTGKAPGIMESRCDGSKPREVVAGGLDPLISRDGRWVSFARVNKDKETYALFVIDLRNGAIRRVSQFGNAIMWTRDSKLLAVTSGSVDATGSTLLFDPANGKSTVLVRGRFSGYSMITTSGTALVYANDMTQNVEKYTLVTKKRRVLVRRGDNRYVLVGDRYYAITRAVIKGSPTTTVVIIKPNGTIYGRVKLQKGVLIAGGAEPVLWYENGNRLLIGLKNDTGGYAALASVNPPNPRYRVIYRARAPYTIGRVALYGDNRTAVFDERPDEADARSSRVVIASMSGTHVHKVIRNAEEPTLNCRTTK
jgi:hypothetical protein